METEPPPYEHSLVNPVLKITRDDLEKKREVLQDRNKVLINDFFTYLNTNWKEEIHILMNEYEYKKKFDVLNPHVKFLQRESYYNSKNEYVRIQWIFLTEDHIKITRKMEWGNYYMSQARDRRNKDFGEVINEDLTIYNYREITNLIKDIKNWLFEQIPILEEIYKNNNKLKEDYISQF